MTPEIIEAIGQYIVAPIAAASAFVGFAWMIVKLSEHNK